MTLYRSDGSIATIKPGHGPHFTLEEMQVLVDGYIEVTRTTEGKIMVVDEEGKLKHKPLNIAATRLYVHGRIDPIVGDAVVFDSRSEFEKPEEPD